MNISAARSYRFLCAAVLAAACAGCGEPIRNKVESHIEAALPRLIGPARHYQVEVSGSPFAIMKGKLSALKIDGRDVQISQNIKVSRLQVSAKDMAVDLDRALVTRVGSTNYSAEITEDALNAYLRTLYSDVPGLRIVLPGPRLRIYAEPRPAGVPVKIVAEAALRIQKQRELVLDLTDIEVYGVSSPGFAREYIESRVNPVFDSRKLGYDATVSNVRILSNRIRLEGAIDLTSALLAAR